MRNRGIATRIALAALVSAAIGLVIVVLGVTVVGGQVFTDLMMQAGDSAEHARSMYDSSVTTVVVVAVAIAGLASIGLAIVMGRMLARPLHQVGAAARRIAEGDYAARVPRDGPEEIASLADSFNQMAASLEEQERMRRDFIANAAHELRTPLTNLQGYLEALRDGVIVADRATYESLWDEAERLVRLSRSLDALAEGDAATSPPLLEPIDLAAAVRSAVELAQPAIERVGLRLSVDVPPRLPARANPDHLAQVLANLLSNAVRYTPSGGQVLVRAEQRPGDLLVSVANSGDAIPTDELERVFERFYRVEKSRDQARGGAGIGLAIVKQLVEASGGRVGADSADGQTRFWFSLPAYGQGDGHQAQPDPREPEPLARLQLLAPEHDRDHDADDRPERARQAEDPGRRLLEPDRERDEPGDVECAARDGGQDRDPEQPGRSVRRSGKERLCGAWPEHEDDEQHHGHRRGVGDPGRQEHRQPAGAPDRAGQADRQDREADEGDDREADALAGDLRAPPAAVRDQPGEDDTERREPGSERLEWRQRLAPDEDGEEDGQPAVRRHDRADNR